MPGIKIHLALLNNCNLSSSLKIHCMYLCCFITMHLLYVSVLNLHQQFSSSNFSKNYVVLDTETELNLSIKQQILLRQNANYIHVYLFLQFILLKILCVTSMSTSTVSFLAKHNLKKHQTLIDLLRVINFDTKIIHRSMILKTHFYFNRVFSALKKSANYQLISLNILNIFIPYLKVA